MERDSITVCVWIFFHSLYSFASLLTLGIEIEIYLFVNAILAFVNAIFVHIANESERAL